MATELVRFIKRFILLVPGIGIAYFSIRDVFPTLDKRLPLTIAIFFTYVLAAYVLIPALIRIVRLFVVERHLPLYCITPDGFASDPINIALVGSRDQLISAMLAAGWYVADSKTPANVMRQIYSAIFNRPYPTAPMSHLYLFGRKQDIGFEIPIEGARGERHHVRFWATTYESDEPLNFRSIHWFDRKSQLRGPKLLWVGAASLDVGISFIRHNAQITHMISPNTNAERDLITTQLVAKKAAKPLKEVRLGKPYWLINRVWRGYMQSDGIMRVLKLQDTTLPPERQA